MSRVWPVLLAAVLFSACSVELQHDLSEDDANDIYVKLQNEGINATKDRDESGGNEIRYKITVAKADVAGATTVLRKYALPRPRAHGLAAFREGKGMIPTATEERAMFVEALAGEVSNSLNRYPGVLEAKVIVNIPEVNDLTQPDKKPLPSASVFIKYSEGMRQPPLDKDAVRRFVAMAVSELPENRVEVLFTPDKQDELGDKTERIVNVLGIMVSRGSADQLKIMIGVGAFLMMAMAGLLAFTFIRGGNGHGNGNGKKRAPAEG
ncbi:MAG: type III secretion protein [Archangiaceae bacterium]|nr:type III secretion protein [Archangiaceae bacterium]